MLGGPPGAPYSAAGAPESRDGTGSGDRNREYTLGDHLTTDWHGRFTVREFCKLLCLKSHVEAGDRRYYPPIVITALVE